MGTGFQIACSSGGLDTPSRPNTPQLANHIDKTHVLSQLRCPTGISLKGLRSRESTPEVPGFGRQRARVLQLWLCDRAGAVLPLSLKSAWIEIVLVGWGAHYVR